MATPLTDDGAGARRPADAPARGVRGLGPPRLRALPLTPVSVGVLAAALLTVVQAVMRTSAAPRGDELIYELMAQDPLATHTFPFAYRIAVPWLVHVLPFDHGLSFQLVAIVCIGAAAGFLFALMTELRTPPRVAAAACALFAVSPTVLVVLLRDGRSSDAATLLVMNAAAFFVVRRRPAALAVTLLAGALVRESALFIVPFAYAVWAERLVDWRAARRVALSCAPAVAAYLTVRLTIPTVGRTLVLGYGEGVLAGRLTLLRAGFEDGLVTLRRVFLAFGPLWLVAPFALPRMRYARRGLVLVALCAVATTFALDWGRIMLLAAPVVYPAAGFVLGRHPRLRAPVLASWLLIAVGYALYMHTTGVEANIDGGPLPPYPVR